MATSIDDEESHYLLRSDSPVFPTPVPSHPFPFLKLPREIRNPIYCYALRRSRATPPDIYYIHAKVPPYSGSKPYQTTSQRTKTGLYLVNRQISRETLELFYSTYIFYFPSFVDVTLVNLTLRDSLSPWGRSMIRSIGFVFGLFTTLGPFTISREEEAGRAVAAVMELLPNIKRVELVLSLAGFDVPEHQAKELVARTLTMVGPLRGFAVLSMNRADHETDQRTRVMREVREELGCQ